MADNVNIIVQDTINDIVVNAAVVVETIDINVQAAVDEVQIIANPNNYVVNINRIIGEQVQSDWTQNDNQAPDYIKNKPTLAAVATSGDYDDLINTPTIPTATSDLTNDGEDGINPFITAADVTAQVNSDWDATSGVAEILNKPTIPAAVTKTSDLTNDGENGVDPFITAADVPAAVTSVGLTMPSAFSVANSPITSAGTLAVTGAGVVSQYVRGDGSLANFPTSTGGGASLSFYLNGSVSQGTFGGVAFKEMDRTPILGAGTDFTIAANGYIQSFITDANVPNLLEIPAGNWNFETYFSASSGGGSPSFYVELYKWNGATLSLIASNSATPEGITNGTAIDLYVTALAVPQTTLLATDRLAVRIYVTHSGRTITLHTENSHLCQVVTTFSTGITALNGLTAQVQSFATGTSGTDFAISSATATHTFNLPTASAANRGALSSTDWNTFNNKFTLPALTSGSVLFSNGTTIAQDNANLFWDDTNNRLGIGTATPLTPLHISGAVTIGGATTIDVGATTNKGISLTNGVGGSDFAKFGYVGGGSNDCFIGAITNNNFRIYTQNTERVRFGFNGNVLINTTTDAGFKLDVNGTARVKGASNLGTTTAFTITNSDSVNVLQVQDNGYIRIGSQATSAFRVYATDISGDSEPAGLNLALNSRVVAQTTAFNLGMVTINGINGTATTGNQNVFLISKGFAPTSGTCVYAASSIIPTINQTGGANGITRGLYINPTLTAAADFRAIEVANGITILGAATTAKASLRIPSGTAPTSPTNGDIWFDGTDLKMRIGGVTKTFTLL
jgi:hypothetical protein